MHELSIAMSIVDLAQEEAVRRGIQVTGVHIKVGALSGVVKDALLSSYEMACAETPLEGSRLFIEEVPVKIFCPSCQAQRAISSAQLFCCEACGAPGSQVLQGRELELVALETTA